MDNVLFHMSVNGITYTTDVSYTPYIIRPSLYGQMCKKCAGNGCWNLLPVL